MNKAHAKNIWHRAIAHIEKTEPDELACARGVGPDTFKKLSFAAFLEDYAWVVYASGFRFATVKQIWPDLKIAFKNFDPDSVARMRSLKAVLLVFGNERKARNFLAGVKALHCEGFPAFKNRLDLGGVDELLGLPGIGQITKNHLAKNIGFLDVPKADVWLQRIAKDCEGSVTEVVNYLSEYSGETKHVVDVTLWTLGRDKLLN